jgi:hypothetical protein
VIVMCPICKSAAGMPSCFPSVSVADRGGARAKAGRKLNYHAVKSTGGRDCNVVGESEFRELDWLMGSHSGPMCPFCATVMLTK